MHTWNEFVHKQSCEWESVQHAIVLQLRLWNFFLSHFTSLPLATIKHKHKRGGMGNGLSHLQLSDRTSQFGQRHGACYAPATTTKQSQGEKGSKVLCSSPGCRIVTIQSVWCLTILPFLHRSLMMHMYHYKLTVWLYRSTSYIYLS